MRSSSLVALAAVVLAALAGAAPGVAAAEGIAIETPAGPVTCAPDPAREAGPEAISTAPFARGVTITVHETGALRCQTSTLGEVEITGAGLPWQLTLNEKRLTARLKGTPRPRLLVQSVLLPSLSCLYQAGKVFGTATQGLPPTLSLSVTRVRLNTLASASLCPALGPLSLALTLP
jgi:hypothetical protein